MMKTGLKLLIPLALIGALAACSDDPEPTAESEDTVDKFESVSYTHLTLPTKA